MKDLIAYISALLECMREKEMKGKKGGTDKNIDATLIFREKILDKFQPLREGFKQESVKKLNELWQNYGMFHWWANCKVLFQQVSTK